MDMQRLLRRFTRGAAGSPAAAVIARSLHIIEDAIETQRQVVAFCGKQWLVFSPHGLAHRADGPHVLAYLLCGHAYLETEPHDPSRRWVWLPVAELWGLEVRDDPHRAVAGEA